MVLKIVLLLILIYLFYISNRNNRLFDFLTNLNDLGYAICLSYVEFSSEVDPEKAKKLEDSWKFGVLSVANRYYKIVFGFKPISKESLLDEEYLNFFNLKFMNDGIWKE